MQKHSPRDRFWVFTIASAMSLIPADAAAVLIVSEPWVRVAPKTRSAEGYVQLRSTEGATLVAVRSDAASKIEIREAGSTRPSIEGIKLPAGETVMLAPGAHRLMLANLHRRLKLGDRIGIALIFMSANGERQEVRVKAEVRERSPTDDHLQGHRH